MYAVPERKYNRNPKSLSQKDFFSLISWLCSSVIAYLSYFVTTFKAKARDLASKANARILFTSFTNVCHPEASTGK